MCLMIVCNIIAVPSPHHLKRRGTIKNRGGTTVDKIFGFQN